MRSRWTPHQGRLATSLALVCSLAACAELMPEVEADTEVATGTPQASSDSMETLDSSGEGTSKPGETGGEAGLVARGLLVRYFIDDARDADSAQELRDAAPDPLALPIIPPGNPEQLRFVEQGGNHGLRWQFDTANGMAGTGVAGTKIMSALDGAGQVTMELVLDPESVGGDGFTSRFMHIGQSNSRGSLMLGSTTAEGLRVRINHDTVQQFDIDVGGLERVVVHLVIDTELPTARERTRVFIDGEQQAPYDVDGPRPGETIALDGSEAFVIGNHGDGGRSMAGTLYYAALYDVAFDADEIAHNVARLSANDDTQP